MTRPRVLLVDDDLDLLRALTLEIETFAEVEAMTSVSSALPLVQRGRFDAVVTDLRMPERWGDELLAHVAARSPATLRLMLTGDADPRRTVRELLESGLVAEVFTKPRAEGLLERLRALTPAARLGGDPPAPSS